MSDVADPRGSREAPPTSGDAGLSGLDPGMLERLRRGFPLRMDRQGNFSFEGDPITHPGIVRLFRNSLDATETGEVTLGLEGKWVYLKLADLPLRALRVDRASADDNAPQLLLDDGRRVPLNPQTLCEEPGAGLRCSVPARGSGRPLGVRLSNTAAIDLSAWFVDDPNDDRPQLEVNGRRWPIPETPPDRAELRRRQAADMTVSADVLDREDRVPHPPR
ncbi:hypothetical protein [Enhygromyxa salina]|uniref:hypothetical protein n=1 Tax=Enhygromyxa salina TaxID=215803 RepID=UPI0006984D12|nr:hypothetical protein [Enhygromyxa salina]